MILVTGLTGNNIGLHTASQLLRPDVDLVVRPGSVVADLERRIDPGT